MKNIFINQFEIVEPRHRISQEKSLAWIVDAHQRSEIHAKNLDPLDAQLIERLILRYAVKPSLIKERFFECDDLFIDDPLNSEIYFSSTLDPNGADISKRAHFFSKRALQIFQKIYNPSIKVSRPNHLIHVTCTGYISPSAPQRIVSDNNWDFQTDITHAYHMGCYAALPAIRIAKALVLAETQNNNKYFADVVHTEMCGLHMDSLAHTPEQIVVQSLFADGNIKYSVSPQIQEVGQNFKMLAISEYIIADSENDMSWMPASWGMQMNLSREVPAKLRSVLKAFTMELFKKAGLQNHKVSNTIFSVHPGGPKIIQVVQEELQLEDCQISESKKILFERGNMSSATLPHIWNEILCNKTPVGTKIVSFAFGPGLTIFGSVFEVC